MMYRMLTYSLDLCVCIRIFSLHFHFCWIINWSNVSNIYDYVTMCIGIERIYFQNLKRNVCIISIMSYIRGIIAADFNYARRSCTNTPHRDRKFARNQMQFNSLTLLLSLQSIFLFHIHTYAHFLFLFLSYFVSSLTFYPYSIFLSIISITFYITHPRTSVHYRKYWISIMKYWMISDNRRTVDIVRNQYVFAFLVVTDSCRRGKLLCL